MSIKRQIRQWKYETTQAWGRLDFGARVALGAAISIGLALAVTRLIAAPLNQKIAKLTDNLIIPERLDPEADEDIAMNREKLTNIKAGLDNWTARLAALKQQQSDWDEARHATVIADVQKTFDRCGILILSETLVPDIPPPSAAPARRRGKAPEPPPAPAPASHVAAFVHDYRIRGSFRQIQAALLLLDRLPHPIRLHHFNLQTDTTSGKTPFLTLAFKLDVRYLKNNAHAN